MKTRFALPLFLCFLLLLLTNRANGQSVVGRWKRLSTTLVNTNGKSEDIDKMMRQAMPCAANIVYTFVANGTMAVDAGACDASTRKMMESMSDKSRWSQSGNKVMATMADKSIPPSTHEVSFSGNTMTWRFNYADNPKLPNPTKVRTMTIVYQRL
jgi:hypothetical protein